MQFVRCTAQQVHISRRHCGKRDHSVEPSLQSPEPKPQYFQGPNAERRDNPAELIIQQLQICGLKDPDPEDERIYSEMSYHPPALVRPALDMWSEVCGFHGLVCPLHGKAYRRHSLFSMNLIGKYAAAVFGGLVLVALSGGLVGFAHQTVAEGDILVYVPKIFPFMILRPKGDVHEFRGFSYVHGIMDLEFWRCIDMSAMPKETFVTASVSLIEMPAEIPQSHVRETRQSPGAD